ncbi:hypothetical protein [Methylobacterium dankookense]|uniref:Uncharacterized protein n=1 Tax=Methylobacterium dankookense TaxID=560405 RepID=A0A564G1P2_9HYPH|nr:hypothetical protein [Methylobacterium dankookense]GJD55171.1 hypothetical protein IFDJLNFL_1053 [Methylobacterium dankookense]VUF14389.1 hypothetical protein MTDSW087_04110 [Methylobacterium dankookense]
MVVIAPIFAALAAATKTGELTFIWTERALPFTKESLGPGFGKVCREAHCPGSAHGSRKAGARRAAEDDATEAQLNALFGWKPGKRGLHAHCGPSENGARGSRKFRTSRPGAGGVSESISGSAL